MAQEFYKKIYTPKELYTTLYRGFRTMKYLLKSKKNKVMTADFLERIMIAVTEVNGCEICSYVHTKIALEHGMSKEEIQSLFLGNTAKLPSDEVIAIVFAQHYAHSRGNPTNESWHRLIEVYGLPKAMGILGAIRSIMIGNVFGIPLSACLSRFRGKPIKNSSVFYEIGMIIGSILVMPVALIHGSIADLMKRPIICFRKSQQPN